MKQICFGVLLVLTLQLVVDAQVPFPGGCPEVKVQEDFKLADYMGVWYEYEKYPFVFEVGRKCMFATYTMTSDDTVSVVNAAINRFTGKPTNVTGTAKVVASGQLSVSFQNRRTNATKVNYEVLGTDYTSYAVVYSCSSLMQMANAKLLWVLTREQYPPESVVQKAEAVIVENKLNKALLMKTKQTECTEKDIETDVDEATTNAVTEMDMMSTI